jgi:hypothetical protein
MLYSRYILGKIEGNYDRDPLLSIHLKKTFPLPPCIAFNVSIHHITTTGGVATDKGGDAIAPFIFYSVDRIILLS